MSAIPCATKCDEVIQRAQRPEPCCEGMKCIGVAECCLLPGIPAGNVTHDLFHRIILRFVGTAGVPVQIESEFPQILPIRQSLIKYVFEPAAAQVQPVLLPCLPACVLQMCACHETCFTQHQHLPYIYSSSYLMPDLHDFLASAYTMLCRRRRSRRLSVQCVAAEQRQATPCQSCILYLNCLPDLRFCAQEGSAPEEGWPFLPSNS